MSIEIAQIKLSKGYQFTLPAKIRKKHDLAIGQTIEIIDLGNKIILKPTKKRNLMDLVGKFKSDMAFDAVVEHDEII
ncbi:MAG: hypothetical protein COT15_04600 [Candidatus Diapherotrites archaeon CG08_land_8_20_14_0_20_34_12]|nr:MAG: hypothetical protein COT15_04600 [Candidatus Diapherotrites archaeon CG08_land_8_20_14_0_20_34_12]